jgi:hypothetical protein
MVGCDREFSQCIILVDGERAVETANFIHNLESHELIKGGNFVAEEFDEFMGVANVFSSRELRRHFDTFKERFQSFITSASPNLSQTGFDRGFTFIVIQSLLYFWDTEDSL